MKRLDAWLLVTCLVLATSGCKKQAAPPRGEAHVIQVTPATGEVGAEAMADGIRVTFDRQVAPAEVVGKVVAGPAFVVTPSVTGEARWLDERTLAFFVTPGTVLRPGQAYTVALSPNLALAGGLSLAPWEGQRLVYERIAVEQVRFQGLRDFQPVTPEVVVTASQPLDKASANGCAFVEKRGDGPLGKSTSAVALPAPAPPDADTTALSEARARRLRLQPAAPLARATSYVVRCGSDFRPAGGGEGLREPSEEEFTTHGDPGIKSITPAAGGEVPADEVEVKLEFATPMAPEEVRKRVSLTTAAGAPVRFVVDADYRGVIFQWSGDLEPRQEYQLVIAKGLVDRFGQALGGAQRHAFRVGDAGPRLEVKTGAFVIDRARPQLPLGTRNLAAVGVTCAPVPADRLAQVLRLVGDYQAFEAEEQGENKHPLAWKKLGLSPQSSELHPAEAPNRWQEHDLELGARCAGKAGAAGVFLLELATTGERHAGKPGRRWRRALASVTDLGLLAKVGNSSSLVWVVRLSTGAPVAGAAVELRDLSGKVRFSGTTDADGVLAGPGAAALVGKAAAQGEDEEYDGGVRPVVVTAQAGDDLAALDTRWSDGLQAWSFGLSPDRHAAATRVRGFIHSDRGLYRPGDTVHLRGLLREIDRTGRMLVPKRRKVQVAVEDPRGATLLEGELPVSAYGSFHRDLVLPPEARLGDYRVVARGEGFVVSERFAVEEYRPRSFEVAVKTGRKNVFLGRRMSFDVSAKYLYGAALRGGKVSWTLRRRPHRPQFPDFEEFVFQDVVSRYDAGDHWARDEDRSFSETAADGQGVLDAAGKLQISTADALQEAPTAQDYVFEASVEDPSGQAVKAGAVVAGHRANLYLGLLPAEVVQVAGQPFAVKVVGFDAEGKRRGASAKLTLRRRTHTCGTATSGEWQCKREDASAPSVALEVGVPAAGAPAVAELTVPTPGQYVMRIEASDGRGATAVSSDLIWVTGAGEGLFEVDDSDRMNLVTSKARYRPGDVARLVPQAALPGALALVTVERDGVLQHRVVSGLATGAAIEVPIEGRFAPNVFVSVTLIGGPSQKDGRFKMGIAPLVVDAAARRLSVTVATERPSYEPGETVKARLKVVSAEGKPVKAELAVAAADEGVLQILGFATPDPQPSFYAPWDLGVDSSTTWNRLLVPGKESHDGEGGDGAGGEAGRVRSRFLATAFWQPALVTRADGSAEVSFVAPDNLTAFRLMAVAADAGERFGAGDVRFTVKKSLQALPALPRFLTVGDSTQAAALVQNNTDGPLSVTVTLEATGVELAEKAPQKLEVPANGNRRVEFPVSARSEGTARFRFRASAGALADAVDTSVPVQRPLVPETLVLGEGASAAPISLPFPGLGAVAGGSLELVLDRTGLSQLDEGLAYLVAYPYGCLEQLVSQVVPMVALRELTKTAGTGKTALAGIDPAALDGFVRAGVAKIVRLQGEDGGFALWPGGAPEIHYSAYALWGLRAAANGGVAVAPEVLRAGASYLQARLGDKPTGGASAAEIAGQAGARAFAHAVLAAAGSADAGGLAQTFENRAQLPVYGRSHLLAALVAAGHKAEAGVLVNELAALAPAGDGPVVLKEPAALDWYWSSDLRTTALALLGLLTAAPSHPLVPRLGEGLLGARVAGRFSTTQENAYGLLALAALAGTRAAAGESRVTVKISGKAQPVRVLRGAAVERVSVPLAAIGPGPLALEISGGRVSYSARLRVLRPLGSAASDRGLAVRREYLDPDTGAALTRLKLGQAVRVRLTVTAAGRQAHVAVADRLPAGLEPIITRFAPSARLVDDEAPRALWFHSWQTAWQHRELHDDRALVFADVLAAGESRHEYLARATSVGSFAAPAATAEAMYKPALNGRSAASTLVIER